MPMLALAVISVPATTKGGWSAASGSVKKLQCSVTQTVAPPPPPAGGA
jgi:hypothetical protein